MPKIATQFIAESCNPEKNDQVCPKQSTIEFLKQFARVYSFDKRLPIEMGGMIVN